MRKLLLFLAVFGTGLAIVLWVDRRGGSPAAPEGPPTTVEEPPRDLPAVAEPDEELIDVPLRVADEGGDAAAGLALSGAQDLRMFDPATGRRSGRLRAEDVEHVGANAFDLVRTELELFDVETGELEVRLTAERGRAKLDVGGGHLGIDESYPATFHEAQGVFESGMSLAPLTATLPVLEADLAARRFTSRERVELAGRGVRASGVGLDASLETRTYELLAESRAVFELADGEEVTLAANGALVTREVAGGLEAEARDGARLALADAGQGELRGDVLTLSGRQPREGAPDGAGFRLSGVTARGASEYVLPEGTFRGDRTTVEFDGEGLPDRARIEGQPRVDLELSGLDAGALPIDLPEEGGGLAVQVSGAGPLELGLAGAGELVFAGPATLTLPDFGATLRARGRLVGARSAEGAFESLTAEGGVTAELRGTLLTCDALELRAQIDASGATVLRVQTTGATRVAGVLEDGRAYTVDAAGGLTYERSREGFRVPLARGVRVEVQGEGGFTASAEEVLDLDGAQLSFRARGGVTLEGEQGRARGAELDVASPQQGELRGGPDGPARYELADAALTAPSIGFSPDRLRGEGGARGTWRGPERSVDVEAPWIELGRRAGEDPTVVRLDAGDRVVTRTSGGAAGRGAVAVRSLELHAEAREGADGSLEDPTVSARGEVEVEYTGEFRVLGFGEELLIAPDGTARLVPPAPEPADGAQAGPSADPAPPQTTRVRTEGFLPRENLRFEMRSRSVEFGQGRLQALDPEIEIEGLAVDLSPDEARLSGTSLRAVAGRMDCDAESILFSDGVYLGRISEDGELWSLDAREALLTGPVPEERGEGEPILSDLLAWGGFTASFGELVTASGERLEASRETSSVRMIGSPVDVRFPTTSWKTGWIEWDLTTGSVRTGEGAVEFLGRRQDRIEPVWTMRYASMQPRVADDYTVQVVREPVFLQEDREVRAAWALFWLDNQEWSRITSGLFAGVAQERFDQLAQGPEPELAPERPVMPSLFGEVDLQRFSRWLQEIYLEGDLRYLIDGEQVAQADAFYLDLVDRHGWFRDVDMVMEVPFGRRGQRVRIHADWLRHSADGSLRADSALLTTCEFEEPGYQIESGDLRVEPTEYADGSAWQVELTENRIVFGGGLGVPLPRIGFPMDERYRVRTDQFAVFGVQPLSAGSDARFGAFVKASVVRDLGWLGRGFAKVIDFLRPDFDASPRVRAPGSPDLPPLPRGRGRLSASYLGSRGGLVDVGFDVESPESFVFTNEVALVVDNGRDRGIVRVPEDDRDTLRVWARGRGRILLDDAEWVDVVYSVQTDPGVMSEFFESDYLSYEERESYLHWRRARSDGTYAAVTAEVRLDDFRTEVVEQPSFDFYRGRAEITTFGNLSLLYVSDSSLAYLRREEGDPQYEPPFPDGLGSEQVLRFDTEQRVELPSNLGVLGARATPFLAGRVTTWDEGVGPGGSPSRLALLTGLDVATTFWRRFGNGALHRLSPSLGLRTDLGVDENGSTPVQFDRTEDPIEGQFVDLRLRSLIASRDQRSTWDLELAATHAAGRPPGEDEGLLPIEVNTEWLNVLGGVLVGIYQDGRFDVEDGETVYSRTFFGVEPIPEVGFTVGHFTGRDAQDERLYEAISLGARWQMTPKFELEGRQTISIQDNSDLSTNVLLRRYGHDFVFEIDFEFRAGEGTSLAFDLVPLVLWKRPRFGFIDRLRELDE